MDFFVQLFLKLISLIEQGTLPVMIPLIGTCLGIGVLTVDRLLQFYDTRFMLGLLWPPLRKKMVSAREQVHRDFDEFLIHRSARTRDQALESCKEYRTRYSRFLWRALRLEDRLGRNTKIRNFRIERAVMEEEVAIEKNMSLLSMLSKVAPLLGLLGTVTGMIATFNAMMVSATGDPKALSSGISIALLATNVGLVVALPGIISMSLLSRRARTLLEEIHLASTRLRATNAEVDERKQAA